jgi:hypothetical protein
MKHTQYDQPGIDLPNTPEEHDSGQYKLKFPNPGQYLIEFPKNSELPDKRPRELPPSELEAKF